jgi:hypothetical protein
MSRLILIQRRDRTLHLPIVTNHHHMQRVMDKTAGSKTELVRANSDETGR